MAFPATPLPIRNEMLLGPVGWVEVTDKTYTRQQISITRGIPDQALRAGPADVTFQLNNKDSRFSARNPAGPYWGYLGRNVPHRIVLDVAADDFAGTRSNGWGTSSSGHTWTVYGGDAADWATGSGQATVDVDTVDSQRVALLDVAAAECEIYATAAPGVVATGASIQMQLCIAAQDSGTFYSLAVVFKTTGEFYAALARYDGGSITSVYGIAVPQSATYTASSVIGMRLKVGEFGMVAGKAWDTASVEPVDWQLHAVDDDPLDAGDVGIRALLVAGNTNTLPVAMSFGPVDVVSYRVADEVTSLPPRWDTSGEDVWTDARAAGILRRLTQGGEPSLSAMYRAMSGITTNDLVPVAYWPLEDGSDATSFAASESTVAVARATPGSGSITFASDRSVRGSLALPVLDGGAAIDFTFPAFTDVGQWDVQMSVTLLGSSSTFAATVILASGYRILVTLTAATTTLYCAILDQDLAVVDSGTDTFSASDIGTPFSLVIEQGDTTFDTATAGLFNEAGSLPYLAFAQSAGSYSPARFGQVSGTNSVAVGHYGVFANADFDSSTNIGDASDNARAMSGFAGEQDHERVIRVCREQGQAVFVIHGDLGSEPMGPQQPGGFVDILEACAETGLGVLSEARDELALVYRTRRHRYNQAPTLELTYGSEGHVAPPLEPMPDDFAVVNDLSVERRDGSSGRYELKSGPLSVLPWPDGAGRYDQQKTLDLHSDGQCVGRASWEVHASAVDEERYPQISLNLAAMAGAEATAVYEAAQRLNVSHRLTIDSLPTQVGPGLVDQQVLELVETIGKGGYGWDIAAHCLPTGPYGQVGIVQSTSATPAPDAPGVRLDTPGSKTVTGTSFTAGTSTSLTVEPTAGVYWGETSDSRMVFPFDLRVRGIVLRCTSIAAPSGGAQVFTISATLPLGIGAGIVIGADEAVNLAYPARYGL